jgi:hypothetical protein
MLSWDDDRVSADPAVLTTARYRQRKNEVANV